MFDLIKNVIQTRAYKDSNNLLTKIQRMYVEGELTEEQYNILRTMLVENAPAKAYDAEAEIDKIWTELRAIKAMIEGGGVEPEPSGDDDIPDFVQPTGAHDAYQKGDKARYNGVVYESLIDGNVWAPDVYPAGWQKLLQE